LRVASVIEVFTEMGRHEDSMPPNSELYLEEIQLKLYQVCIFSIPVLFPTILFLLFLVFCLKRRANSMLFQHPATQQCEASNQFASFLPLVRFLSQIWKSLPIINKMLLPQMERLRPTIANLT